MAIADAVCLDLVLDTYYVAAESAAAATSWRTGRVCAPLSQVLLPVVAADTRSPSNRPQQWQQQSAHAAPTTQSSVPPRRRPRASCRTISAPVVRPPCRLSANMSGPLVFAQCYVGSPLLALTLCWLSHSVGSRPVLALAVSLLALIVASLSLLAHAQCWLSLSALTVGSLTVGSYCWLFLTVGSRCWLSLLVLGVGTHCRSNGGGEANFPMWARRTFRKAHPR